MIRFLLTVGVVQSSKIMLCGEEYIYNDVLDPGPLGMYATQVRTQQSVMITWHDVYDPAFVPFNAIKPHENLIRLHCVHPVGSHAVILVQELVGPWTLADHTDVSSLEIRQILVQLAKVLLHVWKYRAIPRHCNPNALFWDGSIQTFL